MEDKIIENKWEDGVLADIAEALDRARGVVKTADDIKAFRGRKHHSCGMYRRDKETR